MTRQPGDLPDIWLSLSEGRMNVLPVKGIYSEFRDFEEVLFILLSSLGGKAEMFYKKILIKDHVVKFIRRFEHDR